MVITISNLIYKINNIKSKYEDSTDNIMGIVYDIKTDDKKVTISLKTKENILVYYSGSETFNLGDKIRVVGKFNKLNNNSVFNLFNYRKYMLSKNTYYSVNTNNIELINKNKNILYKIKDSLINRIKSINCGNYLSVFILGNNDEIDDNVLESYRTNGISHLFSISGMHISFLSVLILVVLNRIKRNNINYIFVIIFLLFFAFLTNYTPSVMRATVMFIFITLNKIFKLKIKGMRIFIFTLCINLLINPYIIYNVGFKFSYLVTFYLISFSKLIKKYSNYLYKVFIISFISFLASIPIMINNYFSINIMSLINNIIFVPFVSSIVFPFSLVVLIIPKLSFIYQFMINILENLSLFLSQFKLEIVLCKCSIFVSLLYCFLTYFILYKICKKKYWCLLLIIPVIYIHSNINYISSISYVSYIDVGQGDSSFIHYAHNKYNILIDTGGRYNYNLYNSIIEYLRSLGVTSIDYLIISHGDFDHMGEAINLVNNFKVEKVIFNCGPYNDLEEELIKVLDKKKIPYYSCIKELNIDDNKLYFLQTDLYDNENDNSNVIYTEIDGYKFMFMGDAGIEKEKNILEKYNISNIDVLKVGHHGSKTSSSEEFINEMNQKYSIISVGKNNRYGHPNKEVLDNLKDSKIYRTDQDGSIMFKIKNNKLNIETCSP